MILTIIANRSLWYQDIIYSKEQVDIYLKQYIPNLKVLLAPYNAGYDSVITPYIINIMLNSIVTYGFDVIIVDTDNCYSDITREYVKLSNTTLVVGNDDFITLNSIKKMTDTYHSHQYPVQNMKLILNCNHNNRRKLHFNDEEICSITGINEVFFTIEYASKFNIFNNRQKSISFSNSKRYSKDLNTLVTLLSSYVYK